jgi:hypothetical protein
MSLELKSQELKDVVSKYDTQWFLGHLSFLMQNITNDIGKSMIENLSSPMRQLYFLGGLLMSSNVSGENKNQCSDEEWDDIVQKLNEIELEYTMMFFPKEDEEITEHWKKAREIAMPSFLSYFNLGPLNYEEQIIDWVQKLYSQLDSIIESETGLITQDFIQFYENVDKLHQSNFQSFSNKETLRTDWKKYTKLEIGHTDDMPEEMQEMFDERLPLMTFVADYGIICRFLPEDITSDNLSLEKVNKILQLLSGQRVQSDFLYYTSTKPGNPLTEKPIVDIGDGMYQVFEVKQVMHSIDNLLESVCSKTQSNTSKLVEKKGKLLERKIVELFKAYFKDDCEVYEGYYVDGCEQDILILWKDYAFIIEAKGYNIKEPFRDPDKAYVRITRDFNACIGYAYTQTKRVEEKFIKKEPLRITDKDGNLVKEIDTAKYENNDFSIIVNLNSFGAIQTDLSFLLKIDEDAAYPWAVRFDDLEIFILTLIAQKKSPYFLINYLLMREKLHGKLICADESEICGGYISDKISEKLIETNDTILTHHSLADIFDKQYFKGMGFKNEKYLKEKKSKKHKIFGAK